jgi:hypothetical protein
VTALGDDTNARALGAALDAQYELVRLLGRGGMGSVYLAREPFLDRDVAVKVLPSEVASGDARERFLREARTAARLSHPNIVPLYTFGQAGDVLYYVMGFVDGESLESRLRREGRLSFDDARRIASELTDALEYAHEMGVVHRDLKPDNVLLERRTGRAMLTDFGIAKHGATQEALTQTGVVMGTPHYMSPEQASGDREIDGRSDIYSLGVILYRMVTGKLPFAGSDFRQVLAQHAMRAPVPASQVIPSVPIDIDTVIGRALAKNPIERWPNARSMREALSPESDESIPDQLGDIRCGGVRLGLLSLAIAELAYLVGIYGTNRSPVIVFGGIAAAVQVIGALVLIRPAMRFGWRATLEAWFRQPGWWKAWWPRFGRRPGDVWDRLPRSIRRFRNLPLEMVAVVLPYLNLVAFVMRPEWLGAHPAFLAAGHLRMPSYVVVGLVYGWMIFRNVQYWNWKKSIALPKKDRQRLLTEPTAGSSFWTRPHIAALMSPPGMLMSAGASGSPADIVNAIDELARNAASSPHADLYKEAAEAARGLGVAIGHADSELAQLARDADPQEQSRIKSSLARTNEPQMRELLERQLHLVTELEARQAQVRARRERLVEQLRTLSLQIANLRAEGAHNSAAASEITGRIHAICRGIDYRIEGVKEVRAITYPRT